ncbi:unnamed protein product [Leuciscus chuanchicus]
MPPKKKSSNKSPKGRTPTVVDGLSTDEMSKEQLEEHIVRLREELDREREERNYFQLERDKIHTFWEITRRNLEENKCELRNRERDLEEGEERHQVEIKVYKQKVKHLLYEQQNMLSELKAESVVSTKQLQKENDDLENHLQKDMRNLKVYLKEQELSSENVLKSIHLEELKDMKRKEEKRNKEMAEVLEQNKQLRESPQKAKEEVAELQKQLANYEKDKSALTRTRARLKIFDRELKELKWEHEVLEQRFTKVQLERDELYMKFTKAILEVQQKSGFKNLLLECKLSALNDTLEKKEAQLSEVLSVSNLDPTTLSVVTHKLEEVLESKNHTITDLQYEVARVCKAYNDLLKTSESKLRAFGIPVEELGFNPLESSVAGQSLGQGPAALISAPN